MKSTKTANILLSVSLLIAFVPVIGMLAYAPLIAAFILGIIGIAKEEPSAIRVFLSVCLGFALVPVINLVTIAFISAS